MLKGRSIYKDSIKLIKKAISGIEIKIPLMVNTQKTIKQRYIIMGVLRNLDSSSSLVNLEKCKKEFELDVKLTEERDDIMRTCFYKDKQNTNTYINKILLI